MNLVRLAALILFFTVPLLAVSSFVRFNTVSTTMSKIAAASGDNALSAFAQQLEPLRYEPKKLVIESLGINLDIQNVGLDSDGVMETPSEWGKAGWYSKSAKAGEQGNVIINGHYDDNYGRPAAFWELKNIRPGDKVILIDKLGKSFDYLVSEVLFLDIKDPNRLDVVNAAGTSKTLTLITCGGVWLPGKSTYDKRLVVKASAERGSSYRLTDER